MLLHLNHLYLIEYVDNNQYAHVMRISYDISFGGTD